VHISGIMQWTFAGYGIKSTRVGIAYVLDFPGQGGNSLIKRQPYDPGKNIPCRPARGTPFDLNGGDPAIFQFHTVFRQTKLSAVRSCSLQASEPASGKRCHRTGVFLAGSDNRNVFLPAYLDKIG